MGHFGLDTMDTSGSGRPLMDCIHIAQIELVKWLVDDSNLAPATLLATARRPLLTGVQISPIVRSHDIKRVAYFDIGQSRTDTTLDFIQ